MIRAGNENIEGAELLRDCKAAIQRVAPEAEVVLFGSRARGQANQYSDYDLLVLLDSPADISTKEQLVSEIYPLELEAGEMISLVVYNKQQWNSPPYKTMPLHLNIDQEGIVI
jgi:predicted nucleotidyltransferase